MVSIDGIEAFWDRVRSSRRRSLALDYDGTLAPFRVDRMAAVPLAEVIPLLGKIRDETETRLALVSGRPLSELLQLVGDLRIAMIGSHGFERREPDGTLQVATLREEQSQRLSMAEQEVQRRGLASRWERKVASVAVHTRGLPTDEAAALERDLSATWRADADEWGMECRAFNGGIELRALGADKGTALTSWLDHLDQLDGGVASGEHLAVYVGDDDTDEDAFRALQDRGGLGIKVGPSAARTAARGRLADCEAVRDFLASWLEAR